MRVVFRADSGFGVGMTIQRFNGAVLAMLAALSGSAVAAESWPGFRGTGNSTTDHPDLPLTWSETENVGWQVELSGYGQSSPVIAGGQVYVTSTAGEQKETLILESGGGCGGRLRLFRKRRPVCARSRGRAEMGTPPDRGLWQICRQSRHGIVAGERAGFPGAADRS